jgi:hypothetical protein
MQRLNSARSLRLSLRRTRGGLVAARMRSGDLLVQRLQLLRLLRHLPLERRLGRLKVITLRTASRVAHSRACRRTARRRRRHGGRGGRVGAAALAARRRGGAVGGRAALVRHLGGRWREQLEDGVRERPDREGDLLAAIQDDLHSGGEGERVAHARYACVARVHGAERADRGASTPLRLSRGERTCLFFPTGTSLTEVPLVDESRSRHLGSSGTGGRRAAWLAEMCASAMARLTAPARPTGTARVAQPAARSFRMRPLVRRPEQGTGEHGRLWDGVADALLALSVIHDEFRARHDSEYESARAGVQRL